MTWWLRVRAVGPVAATLLATAGLLGLVGAHTLTVPAVLGGGAGTVTLGLLAPLAAAAILAYAFDTRDSQTEARATRPLRRADLSLFACCLVGFSSANALATGVAGGEAAQTATTSVTLCSLSVVITCLVDAARGALAATAAVLVTSTYSPHLDGAAAIRLFQPEANMNLAAAAALIAATAATLVVRYAGRVTSTRSPWH